MKQNLPDKILVFKYDVTILVMAIEIFEELGLDFRVARWEGKEDLRIKTKTSEEFPVKPGTWIMSGWKKK